MLVVEVVAHRETRARFDPALNVGGRLQAATRERGIIVRAGGDTIAIAPPLILTREQADEVVGVIGDALSAVLG